MQNNKIKVSVIIPVYNAAKFIEQTIKSVINQTFSDWELILIDDGSSDNSIEIINTYVQSEKIILLQHEGGINLGVSKTRELGIKLAQGKYIAFLDADDIFYPNKLIEQLNVFREHKDVILVHSKAKLLKEFDANFNNDFALDSQDKKYNIADEKSWLQYNSICNSTVILKASVIKNTKFGLPQLFQYEDWLLWSLISEKGKFYYLNTPLIKYRVHKESATSAILRNGLISPYSKIEYLISLFLLNDSKNENDSIVNEIHETIISLISIYSNNDIEKLKLFKASTYEISNNRLKLKKEYNRKQNIKNSKIFKIMFKIKNVFFK